MLKINLRLIALGIACSVMFLPSIVRAHEGHNHAAHAQRTTDAQEHDHQAQPSPAEVKLGKYERSLQVYMVPDVTLVNADARRMRIRDMLAADGPVMLDFIFTSCATTCPVLSRELAMVPKKLGAAAPKLRLISVSLDPENDTPARLKAYAMQFDAGANWQFLTGRGEDIDNLKQAFDVSHGSTLEAEPLTFLRPAPGKPWVRINGFASAEELANEFRKVVTY